MMQVEALPERLDRLSFTTPTTQRVTERDPVGGAAVQVGELAQSLDRAA